MKDTHEYIDGGHSHHRFGVNSVGFKLYFFYSGVVKSNLHLGPESETTTMMWMVMNTLT